jgi:hypothetical protein
MHDCNNWTVTWSAQNVGPHPRLSFGMGWHWHSVENIYYPRCVHRQHSILILPPRHASVYRGRQQLLVDVTLRKLIRKIISGATFPSAIVEGGDVEHGKNIVEGKQNNGGAKGDPKRKEASQAAKAALTHIELIGSAIVQLKAVNQGLAEVFMEHFGFEAYSSGRKVSSVFRELFIQVCSLRVMFVFGNPKIHP